ncbi:methyltransferase domain-containing protein [Diplocarpon rosae]|nr:methyltransferase domain-containing protein [Diplocarpon rosae]
MTPVSATYSGESVFADRLSSLTVTDLSTATPVATQPRIPPHLSHDPETNLKRSDPFQFGSRLLSADDNVFEFNAWDHVETDETYKQYAEIQYAKQRESPVSDYDKTDVWDAASDELPPGLEEGSVDLVVMIFIFSALSPDQWEQAVRNTGRLLKPGGQVLFRDYGRGDLAQVRFKKGRYLEENFYIRGDGTRVYFFEKDELVKIWTGKQADEKDVASKFGNATGFKVLDLGVDRRLLVNRAKQLKMYRCWMQGRFQKSHEIPSN